MQILTVLILEIAFFLYAWRKGHCFLEGFIAFNLIAVLLTSQVETDYLFGISNAGNLFYGFLLSVIALIAHKYGKNATLETLLLTLYITVGLVGLRFCAIEFNTLNPENEIVRAYQIVLDSMLNTFLGSLSAFASATLIVAGGFHFLKWHRAVIYIVFLTLAEFVDSFVFFFLLFEDWHKFVEFFWVGFTVKCLIHLAFLPVFLWLTKENNKT